MRRKQRLAKRKRDAKLLKKQGKAAQARQQTVRDIKDNGIISSSVAMDQSATVLSSSSSLHTEGETHFVPGGAMSAGFTYGTVKGGRFGRFIRKAADILKETEAREAEEAFDNRSGYERFEEGPVRIGYLFNMLPCTITSEDRNERSALDLYFLQQNGHTFKATVSYEPYFYIILASNNSAIPEVLGRDFSGLCITGDSYDFASKLKRLFDSNFRQSILDQQEARLKLFDSKLMCEKIYAIYSL
jgi:hypothetical protein